MIGTVVAMTDTPAPRSYHKVIIFGLVLLNLAAVAYAVYEGEPGMRDYYLRDGSYITWLFAGQMFSAGLLFVACFFAQNIVPMEEIRRQDAYGWLVFAAGFLLLALDQVFRLREHLMAAMTGAEGKEPGAATFNLVKIVVVAVSIILVFMFRKVVLANFRMVLAFVAGFWFLLMMLIVDMLFESIGVSSQSVAIMEGAAKLLAMAMFTAAPFVALLDRLHDARVLVHTSRRMALLRDIHTVREAPEELDRWDEGSDSGERPSGEAPEDSGPPAPEEVEPVEQEEAPSVEKAEPPGEKKPGPADEEGAEEEPAEEKPAEEKPAEEKKPSDEKPAEEKKPADEKKPAEEAEKKPAEKEKAAEEKPAK